MKRWGVAALLGLLACSDGPGRDPIFEEVGPRPDAVSRDAEVGPDRLPFEAGDVAIGTTDFGPPPNFPFTGLFRAFDGGLLWAREVDGRLALTVGTEPYVYQGSISPAGEVRLVGEVLQRSGCGSAELTGRYSRADATFDFDHRTCGQDLQPLQSRLQGGFLENFAEPSGIFEGDIVNIIDPGGCARGLPNRLRVRWGFDLAADGEVRLTTLVDPVDEAFFYTGRVTAGGFSLLAPVALLPDRQAVSAMGEVAAPVAGQPATLRVRRDVWRPSCIFAIEAVLTRRSPL